MRYNPDMLKTSWKTLIVAAVGLLALALLLAWASSGFRELAGWGNLLAALLLAGGLLWAGLAALKNEGLPRWLVWLTVGAALLRLAAGVLWYLALPVWGYDTEVQQAGYVMEDAFRRDTAAWELARSGQPLTKAFTGYRAADQYGGLLFFSAAVYRYLGGKTHLPLQMVVFTAALSALAVPFTWAFVRRLFGERAARWAAWGMALYPEAVLLGSSQMREAFFMPLAAAALYGLARARDDGGRRELAWVLFPLVIGLPLSPPLVGIMLGLLILVGLGMDDWRVLRNWRLWAALGGLAVFAVVALWLGWGKIAPRISADQFDSPLAMITYWVQFSARWQATLSRNASGWLQKIFDSTPEWFDLPFLLAYGVTRPLLPAQLTAWGPPLWRATGIWRGLGWTLLLPLLVYAPVRGLRTAERRNLLIGLSLAVWLGILIATFWGGGDQWDNPRYRVSFSSLQIALAAWVLAAQARQPDPWLRRVLVAVLLSLAWLLPWYLRRYTNFDQIFGWAVIDLFKLLGLAAATAILYVIWDLAGET